ncbi:MAG: hypothetical protein COV08_03590 [Candidatus Vogelbacteria bacterium CG10_big_fil_rev_8_21_14_0_10_49_38]|uniref:Uncharacterized protein n=1 Tax=Candidatus Vogelbacteria bacterium CG10_big_fil_rev_8_21_14_0_10_49_38 TaxID=1975043 RepID=A0A2H0RGS9_9BACT|nr:MAG: hypothetical protein BK006_03580 [bacterium CG10_49_38]PIR45718.1 MAG: hypothetical protein COV08_03590 [Candidatus Vogelbacteria bacterium CG10_big_fil_rev_8_21_14_0_10_49_38]
MNETDQANNPVKSPRSRPTEQGQSDGRADEASLNQDANKLARAKAALTNEASLDNWRQSHEQLSERLKEAAKNLISDEQKQKQEAILKAQLTRTEAQKKLAQLEEKRRQEEAAKRREFATRQAEHDKKIEQERQAKISRVIDAQAEIDKIKSRSGVALSPIRTFTRDAGAAIRNEGLSAAQIAQSNPPRKPSESKKGDRSWLAGISLVLFLGALILGLWTVSQKQIISRAPLVPVRSALITTDRQVTLDLGDQSAAELTTALSLLATENADGRESLLEIYLTHEVRETTDQGFVFKPAAVDPQAFNDRLALNLPDRWLRFLDQEMMVGVYSGPETSPFYIFRTDNYENVAAAWLEEENRLTGALLGVFNAEAEEAAGRGLFQDKLIQNRDTRILLDEENRLVALTAWLDEKTFLLTTSEPALLKIIKAYSD